MCDLLPRFNILGKKLLLTGGLIASSSSSSLLPSSSLETLKVDSISLEF